MAVTVPPLALAATARGEPAPSPDQVLLHAPIIGDVALRSGGVLLGQVVNAEGSPVVGATVTIRRQNRDVCGTSTDANGMFAMGGLRGGNYTIIAAGTAARFRLWMTGTAPPVARDVALMVSDGSVECGPGGYRRRVGRLLRNPYVAVTLIGAAIAIPLATVLDDDESAS